MFAKSSIIRTPALDPSAYDLVIVGTPVWFSSMSAPAKDYLERMHSHFRRNLAFFLVHGGTGARRVCLQMEEVSGKAPLEVLAIRDSDWQSGEHTARVAAFAQALARHLAPAGAIA